MTNRPVFLLRLVGFELIMAGVISAAITATQGYEWLLIVSLLAILVGGVCLWSVTKSTLINKFESVISGRFGGIVSFAPVVMLSLFLFFYKPGSTVVLSICPLLLAFWLIGIQFIWLGNKKQDETQITHVPQGNRLPVVVLLFICGFLLVPSRVPSLLSGIPLDQPYEFIAAALLIPVVWIINRDFLSNKTLFAVFLTLLIIKILVWALLPQTGFGVRVYTSQQALSDEQWEPGYTTWLNPSFTEVIQSPYKSMREFPVEWVNNRFGFDFDQFWMKLEINGTIHLYDKGRLLFIMRGAKQIQLELTDADTGTTIPAVFVDDFKTLDEDFYSNLPEHHAVDLHGTILYTKFGEARFEPVLLYPDGSIKSLFGNAGVWLSKDATLPQNQLMIFEILSDFLSIIYILTLSFGALQGLASLHSRNQLSTVDIYLAFSSLAAYYPALLIEKQKVPLYLAGVLIMIAVIKILDLKISPSQPNLKSHIVLAGTIFLIVYLSLDINNLRSISIFPAGQDGLEYQTFARNIFVFGDVFLEQTPPRAYKVLFPYVVGILHTVFGQSAAAQFIVNAWCVVLSSALAFTLARNFKLPLQYAILTSTSFTIILCLPSSYVFYFRFGLIEAIAVLFLLATLTFAAKRQTLDMRLAAIITVLFRLDYLGLVIAAIILTSDPMIGGMKFAWGELLKWVNQNIKGILLYVLIIVIFPALIIGSYFILVEGYELNASDTAQISLSSMIQGFMRVMFGGNFRDFEEMISQNSFGFLFITIPLTMGFIVSLLTIFYRRGVFAKIDLRLALLIPSILPAYIVVRPTGYFSRFSFPILALDAIIIGIFLYNLKNKEMAKLSWKNK